MEDTGISIGLEKAPMIEAGRDVCGSITQLTPGVPEPPFFISRPVEKEAPSQTKTLLDLCRELLEKTNEQAKMLAALGNEITRLNAKIVQLEARAYYIQCIDADQSKLEEFKISYGTTTTILDAVTTGQTDASDQRAVITDTFRVPLAHIGVPNPVTYEAGIERLAEEARRARMLEETRLMLERGILPSDRTAEFRSALDSARAWDIVDDGPY